MKVAFVGKGGSGKSTLASLLAKVAASEGWNTRVLDGDINQHMLQHFHVENSEAPGLGASLGSLKTYFRGSNERIKPQHFMKTTPPGQGSTVVHWSVFDETHPEHHHESEGVRVYPVGGFSAEDIGVKCYHAKTGALEILLNHLVDHEKDLIVTDMTAGADAFASGLFTKFDVIFIVLEPTAHSLSVYEQYKKYASPYGISIVPVANKITEEDDLAYILEKTGEENIPFVFGLSPFAKKLARGQKEPITALEEESEATLKAMLAYIASLPLPKTEFYDHMILFHKKNAASWANESFGTSLEDQIDHEFDYHEARKNALHTILN